jgi:hypothetical protein
MSMPIPETFAAVSPGFIDLLRRGDSRCRFPIGTRVVKTEHQPQDLHAAGARGVVTGNVYNPRCAAPDGYLVQFDESDLEVFVTGNRITRA